MVDVLLATYDGERFLAAQLDSLAAQTHRPLRVLARDDGSRDATRAILSDYAARFPGLVVPVGDDGRSRTVAPADRHGAAVNFLRLMALSDAPYAMLCDQDDVWDARKTELMLSRVRAEERRVGRGRPVVVFSDYRAVDVDLNPVDTPRENLQVAAARTELNRLLVQNYVTGCTVMMNHTACAMAGPWDGRILMHDWWLALIASAAGRLVHMPVELTDYRQHGDNGVGATDVKSWSYRLAKMRDPQVRHAADACYAQGALLLERHGDAMPDASRRTLESFLAIPGKRCKAARQAAVVRGGYLKSDLIRSLGFLAWV